MRPIPAARGQNPSEHTRRQTLGNLEPERAADDQVQAARHTEHQGKALSHLASMVCPAGVAAMRQAPRGRLQQGQEYGGRARPGAELNWPADRLGRHRNRIYTTTARCSTRGGQQRKLPCVPSPLQEAETPPKTQAARRCEA